MSDVSRETPPAVPPAPAVAAEVFGSGLAGAERYAALLADAGTLRGLIGPREVPRLWERHLLNCAVLGEVIAPRATVCDVGSGAGLPGVALALARPDLQVTLVEPLLRRTTFLQEVVADLGLTQVEVLRGRADAVVGTGRSFDVVTSRALAPWGRLVGWCLPLVAPGGSLVAMKGASAAEELTADREAWEGSGCGEPEVLVLGAGVVEPATTVIRTSWARRPRVR